MQNQLIIQDLTNTDMYIYTIFQWNILNFRYIFNIDIGEEEVFHELISDNPLCAGLYCAGFIFPFIKCPGHF